ncbi:MAG: hypothetical protein ACRDSZ_01750 [Pseudonocardiaceae bacterium]
MFRQLVTLTMTHGPLPNAQLRATLDTYNTALTDAPTRLRPVPWTSVNDLGEYPPHPDQPLPRSRRLPVLRET